MIGGDGVRADQGTSVGMWKKQIMKAKRTPGTRSGRAEQRHHKQFHFLDLSNPVNIDMTNVVYLADRKK